MREGNLFRQVVMKFISSACIRYSPFNKLEKKTNQDGGTADSQQPGSLASVACKKPSKQRREDQSL